MKRTFKLVAAGLLVGLSLTLAACGGGETGSAPSRADFFAEQDAVSYRRAAGSAQMLASGASINLAVDDAFATDAQGEARLVFLDCLALRVFANTSLQVDQRDQSIECQTRFSMAKGAIEATKRIGVGTMEIATKWAVIKDLDTTYFVHYDDGREMTWVVVKRGAASVTAAGVEVIVNAGEQTWVEPGKAPIDPILACRDLVGTEGTLFPKIDVLTNGGITDPEWLPCPATPTPTPAPTPLPLPDTPTPTPRPTPAPPPLTPYASFVADPTSIQACACTTLRWDAGNVATVTIDGDPVQRQGSRQECPADSRVYSLRASTAAGAVIDRSANVQVLQPSINFRADSTSLSHPGECTTLRWDVENVKAVYLDDQGVAGHDSRQVCPSSTTTYNLRANTACGDFNRSVTIQATGDVTGPAISNVTVSNDDITFWGYQNLCVNSNLGISATITDPAGVDLVVATGIREECLPGESGYEYCGSDNFELLMEIHAFAEADRFFTWSELKFGGEGKLTFRIKARDRFGNQSETSIFTFPVKYCYNIE